MIYENSINIRYYNLIYVKEVFVIILFLFRMRIFYVVGIEEILRLVKRRRFLLKFGTRRDVNIYIFIFIVGSS